MIPVSKYIIYVLPASRDQIPLKFVFGFYDEILCQALSAHFVG